MTIKEQLIHEIEQAPEDITLQLLNFLHLLQSGNPTSATAPHTDESPFICVDGLFVIKTQERLPELDWISLVREERIDNLINDDESLV